MSGTLLAAPLHVAGCLSGGGIGCPTLLFFGCFFGAMEILKPPSSSFFKGNFNMLVLLLGLTNINKNCFQEGIGGRGGASP